MGFQWFSQPFSVGFLPPIFRRMQQVEPPHGSTAGGTELHITGAGFAYVTQAASIRKMDRSSWWMSTPGFCYTMVDISIGGNYPQVGHAFWDWKIMYQPNETAVWGLFLSRVDFFCD